MRNATKSEKGKNIWVESNRPKAPLIPGAIKKIMQTRQVKHSIKIDISNDLSRLLDASCDCV